jgi:hypothetical protein
MKKFLAFFVVLMLLAISTNVLAAQGDNGGDTPKPMLTSNTPEDTNKPLETGSTNSSGSGQPTETATQNQGEDTRIRTQTETNNPGIGEQTRTQIQNGSLTTQSGKQVQVQTQSDNKIQLKSGNAEAQTSMKMTQEQTATGTKLQVQLSNGKNAEVKIMPDTASEKALERLRLKTCTAEAGCSIELKEVGNGEQIKAAYEVKTQANAKFLGLFKTKVQVQAQVDAETGEVIKTSKPWWAKITAE